MNVFTAQLFTNFSMASVIRPDTNAKLDTPTIMPERFSSTSKPSKVSLVPPELSSVSEPRIPRQTPPPAPKS